MNPAALTIEITGIDRATATVQAIRNTLADRRPLHAQMAVNALEATRQYLLATPRHNTATRLGATPTNFRAANARALQGESDDQGAILRIPRNTGLGRAFGQITIRPTGGRRLLAMPATAETYGRQPREWAEDTFDFAVITTKRGPAPVLLWAETAGNHKKGDIAFWMKARVIQQQDRTLLPSDDTYREIGRRTVIAYIRDAIYRLP